MFSLPIVNVSIGPIHASTDFGPSPLPLARGHDAGRVRRESHSRGSALRHDRRRRPGIEERPHLPPVDLHRHDDLRLGVVHRFDRDFAGSLGRPVGERHTVAILRLEQTDHTVRKVEFDIDVVEEVVAQDDVDPRRELPCARDDQVHAPADRRADAEAVHLRDLDRRFAADAEHPIVPRLPPGEIEPARRRRQDHAAHRAGVEHDADRLAVGGTLDDRVVTAGPNGPLVDPYERALGRRRADAACQREAGGDENPTDY